MIRTLQGPITRIERAGLIAALVLAIALMWPLRHHVTDQTYLHLQVARHMAAGEGLVFNVGERVYGFMTPLWVTLIADGMALGLDGLTVAHALGALATLASIGFFFQLTRRTLRMPALRAFATVAWAGHAWMLQWSLSGVETPLAVALLLAGFVAFTEGKEWASHPIRTGAAWTLMALVRPEAVLLLLLWSALLLVDAQNRAGVRRLVFGLAPPVIIYGAWLVFARVYFGTFWPQALAVEARGSGLASQSLALARQLGVVASTDGVFVVLLVVACILGRARWRPGEGSAHRMLPWVWMVALPLLYAARGIEAQSRHLLLVLPILSFLTWRAAESWWIGTEPVGRRPVQAAVFGFLVFVVVLAQNLSVYRARVLPEVLAGTARLERTLVAWGNWFGTHTQRGESIATPEIGAIGYFSGRRVVDLTGLVTPGMLPYLARETKAEVVGGFRFESQGRPEYLVDRSAEPYQLRRTSRYGGALVPLGTAGIYSFYRVDWNQYDELRALR